MFFESFSKGPRGLPYVFLITRKVPTLEPVDGPLLFSLESLSLGEPGGCNGAVTFEVGLYAILTTDLSNAFA